MDITPVEFELTNLVKNYPVEPGDTISHRTMGQLCNQGMAVRDNLGRWIPTAKAVRASRPVQPDRIPNGWPA